MSSINSSSIDAIRELQSADSPDVLATAVTLYLTGLESGIERIRKAIREKSGPDLREKAHSLKSSSASLGALTLAELCARLEKCGKDGDLGTAGGILENFLNEARSVEQELLALPEMKEAA